jgi:prepilin-type N-terminal cleavage/methylation domain-containing protein
MRCFLGRDIGFSIVEPIEVTRCPNGSAAVSRNAGFTLIEILMVVAIAAILAGVSMPPLLGAVAHAKLRGSSSNLSGLIQRSRVHAVKRNKTVTVHFITVGNVPFAVVKDVGDTSTNLGATDPQAQLGPSEIQVALPSVSTPPLSNAILSYTPMNLPDLLSFNPRGLPCKYAAGVCTTAGFVYYLTDTSRPNAWTAVSISPGGRVKQWFWDGREWID